MSWTISLNEQATTAISKIRTDNSLPESIKPYLVAGVEAVQRNNDHDVRVTISGSGHITASSTDTTFASINIQKAPEV